MSRDTALKLAIMSLTALFGAVLLATAGMTFSIRELVGPLGVTLSLGPCAIFYHRRQTPQFVMTLLALIQLMVFTSCFTVAMYGATSIGAPLADGLLATADEAMGVHVPSIVQWAAEHPQINKLLMWAYNSVLIQTLFIVLLLGFFSERRPLEQFVLRYMISLIITLLFFAAMPAEGPFSHYGYATSPHQEHYLEHFLGVRSGERTVVSLADCDGLVTFPSFHTTFAILLAAAVWHRRWLFVPFAVLNLAVVVAVLTSGWHYGIDVLGGIAVAVATIFIANRLQRWLYATPTSDEQLTVEQLVTEAAVGTSCGNSVLAK